MIHQKHALIDHGRVLAAQRREDPDGYMELYAWEKTGHRRDGEQMTPEQRQELAMIVRWAFSRVVVDAVNNGSEVVE